MKKLLIPSVLISLLGGGLIVPCVYAQTSKINNTSLTKSDQDKTDISTLFDSLDMGPFSANASPKDDEILQFLYDQVKGGPNEHVINDLTVGAGSTSGTTVTVPVSANSAEYIGSVEVAYEVTNDKIPLRDVLLEKDLYDASDSLWLSKPSSRDVVKRVEEKNRGININAIDVDRGSFGYSNGKYTVEIKPASWSSLYEGTVTVQWSPGLNVNIDPWSTGNNVDYGYSTAPTATLSINKTLSTGTVTYEFDNNDTTSADGRFTIDNINSTLQFKTGANSATTYTCKVKAIVTGNTTTYTGETQTTEASITVNANNRWEDIFDANIFTDSDFNVNASDGVWGDGTTAKTKRNRIWYNESIGLIKINFTNLNPKQVSTQPLVLFKWSRSKYTVQSIYSYSLMEAGSGAGGRTDLYPVLDNTDSSKQSLLIGPDMNSTSGYICGYVLLNVKATSPTLNWVNKTISYNPERFTSTTNITCEYNLEAGLIHLVGNNLVPKSTISENAEAYLFTMDNSIQKFSNMWQSCAVTKTSDADGKTYNVHLCWTTTTTTTDDWNVRAGWTTSLPWSTGYSYSFDIMLCTRG